MSQDDWSDIEDCIDAYVKWKEAKAKGRKAQIEVDAWWDQA